MEEIEKIVNYMITQNITLSIAESLTGGLLSSKICSVSGASKIFLEGIVCYSEESKIHRLGIEKETIDKYSTVSEEVAYKMAENVRMLLNSDIGLSTTGVAGPNKIDSYGNPKGLYYIGISYKNKTEVFKFMVDGSRKDIQNSVVLDAIKILNKKL